MKSLAKNSIYNVIYKCLNVVFPLFTAAYVSRILLPEGVGKVSSAQNIVTYFTLLAALGLPTYGVIAIASASEKRTELSKTFSELFAINGLSSLICTVIYYAIIATVPFFKNRILLFAITGMSIPLTIINVDWFYQGREEYKYIMLRSVAFKIIALGSVFTFVRTQIDYTIYAFILVFAQAANYIFNIIHIGKYVDIRIEDMNIKQHLKPVFVLLAAVVSIEVYTLADTTMLTFLCGDTIVGYYTTAMKGINVIKTLVTSVSAVFLPRLSYYYSRSRNEAFIELIQKGFRILAFLTIPAAVGLILIANNLIPVLFGPGFTGAILTTRILALSIITVGFSNFIGYQILVTIGKERIMLFSTIIGAVVNIILNSILITIYKQNGAAIASVITECCVAIAQFCFIRREISIKVNFRFAISLFASNLVMGIAVYFISRFVADAIISVIISITVGVLVYFAINVSIK